MILIGLTSFFYAGEPEGGPWNDSQEHDAVKAAGAIHRDD